MNHAHNNNRPNTSRSSGGLYRSAIALEFFHFSRTVRTRSIYTRVMCTMATNIITLILSGTYTIWWRRDTM